MKTLISIIVLAFSAGCAQKSVTQKTDRIDREEVRRAVRSSLPSFKSCYESEFKKDSTLKGQVNVAWEIHAGGIAKNVHINTAKTTLENPAVQQCVVQTMSQIQFPEPPKGTVAEVAGYPFVFSKK